MRMERQATKTCLVGILSIVLAGCSDSGGGDENASDGGAGAEAIGGAASIGGGTATSTGGVTETGAGGATETTTGGMTETGTGGVTATGTGGVTETGTGGVTETGTGGMPETGTGGVTETGTGGVTETGTGGVTETGTGGVSEAGAGGASEAGTGGVSEAGTGGVSEAGTGGVSEAGASGGTEVGTSEVTVLLAGDNVNADGPLRTTVEENLSFSGGGHVLVRPTDITSEPSTKHPVAIWGPGGGTPPGDYMMLMNRMASQGFVIVGIRESSGGSELMSAAIDWLEEQNRDPNSPMYDRLILDRVGAFGHSMGGLSSEAVALVDGRVATALLDNSGAFGHDQLVNMQVPVGIIYGEDGMERPNAEGDYNNSANQGPCWLGMMAGGGHGSGPWDGAGANVAWMRWHIGGENFRRDAFLGNGGDYNNSGVWTTQFKNWDDWKNWNE